MSKKLILLYIYLIYLPVFSQQELVKLDYKVLKENFFNNANSLAKQKIYAQAILKKAKLENNNREIIRGYYFNSLINKGDVAIQYLDTVIQYSTDTNDENFPNSAYCEKAAILEEQFKYKEALENYLLAEKYALKKKRMNDYYLVKLFIGVSKSENLGEVQEALKIYKEVFQYFKKNDPQNYIHRRAIFALADAYKAVKETDSATFYNKLGFKLTKKFGNKENLYLFQLNEGANLVLKKQYQGALDSVNKAILEVKKYNDKENLMASYFYLGKIYDGMGNKPKAIENFIKIDSIHTKEKIMYPELIEGYHYLINHYKNTGNKEKQLEFLTKFTRIDSVLQKNHNNMYKLLVKEYDLPNLIKEKENLIQSLKSNNTIFSIGLVFFLFIIIILIYYQYKIKQRYKQRFKAIIEEYQNNQPNITPQTTTIQIIDTPDGQNKIEKISKESSAPQEVVIRLLKSLEKFELEKEFLQKGITQQALAKTMGTNHLYLSRTINVYKEKKFNDYINDLRIDECVHQLQNNPQFLKYTIDAIANEFGFKTEDTFSSAFYKRVKLKPSFFINELKRSIDNEFVKK